MAFRTEEDLDYYLIIILLLQELQFWREKVIDYGKQRGCPQLNR